MPNMTRSQEIAAAQGEIDQSLNLLRSQPGATLMLKLVRRVYLPFVMELINTKHDSFVKSPGSLSLEDAVEDVVSLIANMISEMARHMVHKLDVDGQFEASKGIVSNIAKVIQSDLLEKREKYQLKLVKENTHADGAETKAAEREPGGSDDAA